MNQLTGDRFSKLVIILEECLELEEMLLSNGFDRSDTTLFAPVSKLAGFKDLGYSLKTFRGRFNVFNIDLFNTLRTMRPTEISVVTLSPHFFQSKLVPLSFWCFVLKLPLVVKVLSPKRNLWKVRFPLEQYYYGVAGVVVVALGIISLLAYQFGFFVGTLSFCLIIILSEIVTHLFRVFFESNYFTTNLLWSEPTGRDLKNLPLSTYSAECGFENQPAVTGVCSIAFPTFKQQHSFSYKVDRLGRRITGPSSKTRMPIISIYGCSFTFGISVDDNQTFAWQIQDSLEQYQVFNYGVPGFSTYQAYKLLEKTIQRDKPELVVLAHADFHQIRNVDGKTRWMNLGRASCESLLTRKSKKRILKEFPTGRYVRLPFSMSLLFMEMLEFWINVILVRHRTRPDKLKNTTEHLFLKFKDLCDKNNARFLVACITRQTKFAEFLRTHNIDYCICGPDTGTQQKLSEWTSLPFDPHPNARAHQFRAERLVPVLKKILRDEKLGTQTEGLADMQNEAVLDPYIYPLF